MIEKGVMILSVLLIIYILYKVVPLIYNKYFATPAAVETFKNSPSPAPSTGVFPSVEPPRTISPGGPNSPNAATPKMELPRAKIPDEKANDPFAETNTEVPMKDNLRHPERMFSPPVPNTGTTRDVQSGIAGDSPSGKFSPDTAQNGGEFMKGIFANDMDTTGNQYSEI